MKIPHWSVSIIDLKSCEVLFNSAVSAGTAPPPAPVQGAVLGAPSDSWEYWTEPTDLDWCVYRQSDMRALSL